MKSTVLVSFNTAVRQTTEMFQEKKTAPEVPCWLRLLEHQGC